MTKTELARLACAVAIHRPDWPETSIRTFLERHLAHRPYLDVAVALTWVAVDPNSTTPARILEAGPWWKAASTNDVPRQRNTCPDHPTAQLRTDPISGDHMCADCWTDRNVADPPAPRPDRPMPAEARAIVDITLRRPPADATASRSTQACADTPTDVEPASETSPV